ncbi:flagellar FliJ protein [Desulfonatronum thiosulfatophilum]|uniref:Flagellar FliJ protein n=1 Tax=Desulfonatronum thiosulfatophilum TaxID=617002 RepID=A0A1G6CSK5_9BACT|nr:flagellar export protein FliJ [Desulfonatronum thiosulfatophilum]SDB35843.1 flagellar FliJ protein [Desulfonatronum thiosulfatophilum]
MRKPFHFSLEHVLDYRRQLVDSARLELIAAQKIYQAQARKLDDMRRKLEEAASQLESNRLLATAQFWLWNQYREHLLQDIAREEHQLQKLAAKVAACRGELIQRSKDAKILERLRNRKALDYYEQEKNTEQKELDEMAALRHQFKGV